MVYVGEIFLVALKTVLHVRSCVDFHDFICYFSTQTLDKYVLLSLKSNYLTTKRETLHVFYVPIS